jgi:hypothetical protein
MDVHKVTEDIHPDAKRFLADRRRVPQDQEV